MTDPAGVPKIDVITMGRASVDLYGQQIGSRLEDIASFRQHRHRHRTSWSALGAVDARR